MKLEGNLNYVYVETHVEVIVAQNTEKFSIIRNQHLKAYTFSAG